MKTKTDLQNEAAERGLALAARKTGLEPDELRGAVWLRIQWIDRGHQSPSHFHQAAYHAALKEAEALTGKTGLSANRLGTAPVQCPSGLMLEVVDDQPGPPRSASLHEEWTEHPRKAEAGSWDRLARRAGLTEGQWLAGWAYWCLGWTHQAIGKALEITPGAARCRITGARRKIKAVAA